MGVVRLGGSPQPALHCRDTEGRLNRGWGPIPPECGGTRGVAPRGTSRCAPGALPHRSRAGEQAGGRARRGPQPMRLGFGKRLIQSRSLLYYICHPTNARRALQRRSPTSISRQKKRTKTTQENGRYIHVAFTAEAGTLYSTRRHSF